MQTLRHLFAAAVVAPLMAHAATVTVDYHVNGDDQFKVHLATTPADPGFQYGNGYGWSLTYPGRMLLPEPSPGRHYADYWINVFVSDIGGGGPTWMGDFSLVGSGCTFDNGTKRLVSNTTNWRSTDPLPQTFASGAAHPGYPSWATTYLPPYVQPTLAPSLVGVNNAGPYPFMPQVDPAAQWISNPTRANFTESWFQAHIRCRR